VAQIATRLDRFKCDGISYDMEEEAEPTNAPIRNKI
jgi:hypothetical protein